MAATDWTDLTSGLTTMQVNRGVTTVIPPAPGGGPYTYGWRSTAAYRGAVAHYVNAGTFGPMAKGGSVRGCLQRAAAGSVGPPGGGGFSPCLFLGAQTADVNAVGYMLGLCNSNPTLIVLAKTALINGIPQAVVGVVGVLAKSIESFVPGTWLHLRLDAVLQLNGDVQLTAWQNNLGVNPIGTPPVWQPVPGMGTIVDDAGGINTGSAPLVGGYAGMAFGQFATGIDCRAFVEQVELFRQT